MFKSIIRWLDPILLIGLFISIAISVGMILTGKDTFESFSVGILSTIITLLLDIAARIQKVQDSVLEAAELSRILSNEPIGKALREIANNYAAIRKVGFNHYHTIADRAIDDCRTRLRDLASGSVLVTAKSVQEYAIIGIEQAQREIKAIHLDSMEFWNSVLGKKLFDLNRAAIKRNVQITRIFLLATDEVNEHIETLKAHEKVGIQVFVVDPEHLSREFTIFDNRILMEVEGEEEGYRRERITIDPAEVTRKSEEFQHLIVRYGKTVKDIVATQSKNAPTPQ